jgi:hypothetical protein
MNADQMIFSKPYQALFADPNRTLPLVILSEAGAHATAQSKDPDDADREMLRQGVLSTILVRTP